MGSMFDSVVAGCIAVGVLLVLDAILLGLYWLYLRRDLNQHRKRLLVEFDTLTRTIQEHLTNVQ